jgi:hypothetical protein
MLMRKTKKKGRQITRSKKVTVNGIQFASKLEAHMYSLLKKHKINVKYEGEKFVLIEGFRADFSSYEKTPTKKYMHDRGFKNILPITYTPDFIDAHDPPRFIIECKGNPNERFPLVWKLFKRYIHMKGWKTELYMPRNQKDCEAVVKLIVNSLQ